MNVTKLTIYRGLPGSGKTTLAKAWVAEDPAWRARVNRDDIRAMLHDGVWKGHATEQQVVITRNKTIKGLLEKGFWVVCDDTNLSSDVKDLCELAESCTGIAGTWEIEDLTNPSHPNHADLEMCIMRDCRRAKPVGEQVIKSIYQKYLAGRVLPTMTYPLPRKIEVVEDVVPYVPDTSKPLAICVDIDGCVALMTCRGPFDESLVHTDLPNLPVVATVKALHTAGHKVLFVSGRTDKCRDATYEWLQKYFPDVEFLLYMRAAGDSRRDSIVKRELFDGFIRDEWSVVLVIDDRSQVVSECWRAMGITTLQCAEGNF